MNNTLTVKNPASNIALPSDDQLALANFSVIVYNSDIHSDIYVMQMLTNIFNADKKKAAEYALKIHREGKAVLFTGSRDNCRELAAIIARHGGCVAANLMLNIDNSNGLRTEIVSTKNDAKGLAKVKNTRNVAMVRN